VYELKIETHFSAAHNLRDYVGKCERLHGHNYRVELVLGSAELGGGGMVMDFHDAKRVAADVLDRLDHAYLNEVPPFDELNPTTENIARHVAEQVAPALPDGVSVARVTCWESHKCAATYIPPAQAGEGSR